MISSHTLDSVARSFWTRPESVNAWRLCFEDDAQRIPLLIQVLRHLPADRGQLEFLDEAQGGRFVLLITKELSNTQSWENQAWILSVLAETRAVTTFGGEGAFNPYDFTKMRANDPQRNRETAVRLLRESRMGPLSFVGITASEAVTAYGIDDVELYEVAIGNVRARNALYFDAIQRRAPQMLENMLAGMIERKLSVVGASLTDYNYDEFHRMLRERRIAHGGIRPRIEGPCVSFEEYWKKLLAPEPDSFRHVVQTVQRWIGL